MKNKESTGTETKKRSRRSRTEQEATDLLTEKKPDVTSKAKEAPSLTKKAKQEIPTVSIGVENGVPLFVALFLDGSSPFQGQEQPMAIKEWRKTVKKNGGIILSSDDTNVTQVVLPTMEELLADAIATAKEDKGDELS